VAPAVSYGSRHIELTEVQRIRGFFPKLVRKTPDYSRGGEVGSPLFVKTPIPPYPRGRSTSPFFYPFTLDYCDRHCELLGASPPPDPSHQGSPARRGISPCGAGFPACRRPGKNSPQRGQGEGDLKIDGHKQFSTRVSTSSSGFPVLFCFFL
jgi:hypothetical protein